MTCHSMINFSGILKEDDVLYLEQILERIPEEKFKKMRQNVSQVDKSFYPFLDFVIVLPKTSFFPWLEWHSI